MLEKDLYPLVENWLKKKYYCFKTGIDTGLKFSRADVIGIRDVGGDLTSETETIIIEVKKGTQAFATSAGQTLSYKVFANRVFLADFRDNDFTIDERMIANHLGIGLIRIMKNNCKEILSSPYYSPIPKFSSLIFEKMKLGKCKICGSTFNIGIKRRFDQLDRNNLSKALEKNKGLMFWNFEVAERKRKLGLKSIEDDKTYEWIFICKECVEMIKG